MTEGVWMRAMALTNEQIKASINYIREHGTVEERQDVLPSLEQLVYYREKARENWEMRIQYADV